MLSRSGLGTKNFFDGMLRFAMPNESESREKLEKVMRANIKTFVLITMREIDGGARIDVAYQVRLRKKRPAGDVLKELTAVPGISDIHFMMQDATTEV